MNLRRHLLETATLLAVAVAVALVSNSLASRERKLKLPGDYPNATVVTRTPAVGDPSSPSQAVSPKSSPATAQQGSAGFSSKVNGVPAAALAEQTSAAFPPHPDRPYVEISGEDAARLFAAGVPFLDARRTSAWAEGHIAGARPFSAWESDVDEKVLALIAERDGALPLVLYCSGGDCEDSHLLAQKLWGAGFNNNLVYRDGYPDWVKRGGAVRTGAKP